MIGSALLHRGHSKGDKYIGIFSQNRPEVRIGVSLFAHGSIKTPILHYPDESMLTVLWFTKEECNSWCRHSVTSLKQLLQEIMQAILRLCSNSFCSHFRCCFQINILIANPKVLNWPWCSSTIIRTVLCYWVLALWLQWTISELACYTYSLVAVPLYDTLGTEAISYIIDKGKNTPTHTLSLTRLEHFCWFAPS